MRLPSDPDHAGDHGPTDEAPSVMDVPKWITTPYLLVDCKNLARDLTVSESCRKGYLPSHHHLQPLIAANDPPPTPPKAPGTCEIK